MAFAHFRRRVTLVEGAVGQDQFGDVALGVAGLHRILENREILNSCVASTGELGV